MEKIVNKKRVGIIFLGVALMIGGVFLGINIYKQQEVKKLVHN